MELSAFLVLALLYMSQSSDASKEAPVLSEDDLVRVFAESKSDTDSEHVLNLLNTFKDIEFQVTPQNQEILAKLLDLKNPLFCVEKSLYDRGMNEFATSLMPLPKVASYIYSLFREKLEDGCLEDNFKPSFVKTYEVNEEIEETKKQLEDKYNHLWNKFYDLEDKDPYETLDILTKLQDLEKKPRTLMFLERLLELAKSTDSEKSCTQTDKSLDGYISKSWMALPKIARYIDHFQKLKTSHCSWLAMTPEQRQSEPNTVTANCVMLVKSEKRGFDATFKNAHAILTDSTTRCGEKTLTLAKDVVDLASCDGLSCCQFAEKRKEVRQALASVSRKSDIQNFVSVMRTKIGKKCAESLKKAVSSTVERLKPQIQSLHQAKSSSHMYRGISEYLESKVTATKILGTRIDSKKKKLAVLDNLLISPCNDVLRQVTSDLRDKYDSVSNLVYHRNDVSRLFDVQKWCLENQEKLSQERANLTKNFGILSCLHSEGCKQ